MARNLITLWGPEGNILDYARRTWSGLVSDYYGQRWSMFFKMLQKSFQGEKFVQRQFYKKFMTNIGIPFSNSDKVYPTEPKFDTRKIVTKIYHKWILPYL